MIDPTLKDRVIAMRDEFASMLDLDCETIDGELRVKLAKAELVLNKIGKLLAEGPQPNDYPK